jgi:acyl-CoA synthetase (NDP forming)
VSKKETGRHAEGRPHEPRRARPPARTTGALAGNDKIYDDVLRQSGRHPRRAFATCSSTRAHPGAADAEGENVVIITGAAARACCSPTPASTTADADGDAAGSRRGVPQVHSAVRRAGNPVDITGGEPPTTYKNTIRWPDDPRIHALILGYWHTIITPPMVFANLVVEVIDEMRRKGIHKPSSRRSPATSGRGGGRIPVPARHSRRIRIRRRCPWPCSGRSTSGRAVAGLL